MLEVIKFNKIQNHRLRPCKFSGSRAIDYSTMVGIAGFVSALQWNSWCFMDSSRFFDVARTLHTMFKNTVLLAFAKYLSCILNIITIYKDSDISVEYRVVQRVALLVLFYD